MKYISTTIALALLLVLAAPDLVIAGDYITDAVQALQHTPVYVAPGTEGTDTYTADKLKARLKQDDNVVLVMLPAKAEAELGADLSTIVSRLSEQMGDQRVIGLAVGNKVVGYALALPAGVAADQMRRAQSVSNDPVTALGTFAQNIHLWQAEHPHPQPLPIQLPQSSKSPWLTWLLAFVAVVCILVGLAFVATNHQTDQTNTERTRFKAPDQVKDLLYRIAQERGQVNDRELQQVLYQMCLDIEKYFQSSSNDKKRDALFFKDRLTEVAEVLAKYVDVQQNRRYYYEPETELRRGQTSITDFSQYVLDAIRRGNAADLLDYKVNTNILQAQRYR